MNLITDYNTLVIVGLWNEHIFNPEWIGKFLLPETKLTSEYPINISGSCRVSSDKLRIYVIGNRLHIVPLIKEVEIFDLIQEIALKICSYLPHTPVNAFGVNFLFEAQKSELLNDFFNLPDLVALKENSINPISTSFKHVIKKPRGTLTIAATLNDNKVQFDFNNNFEIKSLIEFKELISETSIVCMLNDAENLLKTVYIKG